MQCAQELTLAYAGGEIFVYTKEKIMNICGEAPTKRPKPT